MSEKPRGVALGAAQWQAAYERHVTAVGEVAYHWNLLHERLGELFQLIAGTTRDVGMGIWYSTSNDRAQREMLLAALRNVSDEHLRHAAKAREDVKWLTDYVNRSLADRRNDAIHAPFEAGMGIFERADGKHTLRFEIGPAYYLGNPRASKLKEKVDLVPEFEWYAETAQTLTRYAQALLNALMADDAPWPEKPRLPSLRQSPTRTG